MTIALFLTVLCGTAEAQDAPDDRYKIQLTIGGSRIQGSQERTDLLLGKSSAEQEAILNAPLPVLVNGSRAQLSILVTDPNGVTTDFSRSSRLQYEHFGCLTVTTSGLLTVSPSGRCAGPKWPGLWIVFADASGKPLAYNEFLFQVP
jgi:hypothetical protein